jgi:phosphohistidine phosphatase
VHRLILVRHARATHAAGPDADRELTSEGHSDAKLLGAMLVEQVVGNCVAVVSTARRAQQTWQQCQTQLPDVTVRASHALYGAIHGADAVVDVIREVENAYATLIVVAHNPGLEDLMLQIPGAASLDRQSLPTSGIVVLDVDSEWAFFDPRQATAIGLAVARSHT